MIIAILEWPHLPTQLTFVTLNSAQHREPQLLAHFASVLEILGFGAALIVDAERGLHL